MSYIFGGESARDELSHRVRVSISQGEDVILNDTEIKQLESQASQDAVTHMVQSFKTLMDHVNAQEAKQESERLFNRGVLNP